MKKRGITLSLFLICSAKKIVRGSFVEIRQFDQDGGWDIIFSGFVLGIAGLRHAQYLRNLRLGQIMVLT